jgi:hypothetical protein
MTGTANNRKAAEFLRTAAYITTIVAAAAAAHYSTKAEILVRVQKNESDISYLRHDVDSNAIGTEECCGRLDAHIRRGPDGLPHPEGVISALRRLEERIAALEAK